MSVKILAVIKLFLILVIVQLTQNNMIIQTNQSLVKRKTKPKGVAIQEFVGLKLKIHSSLKAIVNIKKNKSVNKNVTATISHIEYKNIMLNNKSIRICPSMNRI